MEYRDFLLDSRRGLIHVGLLLAVLLFVVIEPAARHLIPADTPRLDNTARWLINVPAILAALFALQWAPSSIQVERILLACLSVILLSNATLMWFAGEQNRTFYAVASIQIMLFGFILIGLRFRPAFICILLCFGITASAGLLADLLFLQANVLTSAYVTPLLVFSGLAFAAYMLDMASRSMFVSNRERNRELAQRLALESERSKWLKVGSDYLNHEIKNALLGVTSSLSLIRRRNTTPSLTGYVDRAEHSAQFMGRLLKEVSTSTSLRSALDDMHPESVDLAHLLEAKAGEFRDIYPEHEFTVTIDTNTTISCDPDRILQVVDKLLDNAVSHSHGAQPIQLHLARGSSTVNVSVANLGDALPENTGDIFEPFVSHKTLSENTGFGFGLYIVKMIVEAHGGEVTAVPLIDPEGAMFSFTLPMQGGLSQTTSSGTSVQDKKVEPAQPEAVN